MPHEHLLALEDLEANVTLERFGVTSTVNSSQMLTQTVLSCKLLAANLALVFWSFSAMNSCQMSTQITLVTKVLAANLALVSRDISAMKSSQM